MHRYLKDTNTAVMEMASAAGITLVPDSEKNPLLATSYGVGEMINDAIQRGCRNFIIGIGGSVTNDGGIGMLKALGVRFLDENGADVVVTGEGRLDFQTAMGKAPVGVARLAKKYNAKVIAFAGSVTKEATACNNMTATVEQVFRLL